jgi:riboflavin kinase/FMN adenylyltransferase
MKGQFYRVALNIGLRPTVLRPSRNFASRRTCWISGSLYGEELEIEIGEKLRDERKFNSPAELRAQITSDIADVRKLI